MKQILVALATIAIMIVTMGAGTGRRPQTDRSSVERPESTVVPRPVKDFADTSIVQEPVIQTMGQATDAQQAAGFKLRRVSVNSGGIVGGVSGSLRLGASAGQSIAGKGSGADLILRAGFWHGNASDCPITQTGDANGNGIINATDAIYIVNFVFRAGPAPLPCPAVADVNCSGAVNATDVIFLVNYVFRAGAAPCDACTMIPDLYNCP